MTTTFSIFFFIFIFTSCYLFYIHAISTFLFCKSQFYFSFILLLLHFTLLFYNVRCSLFLYSVLFFYYLSTFSVFDFMKITLCICLFYAYFQICKSSKTVE